METTKSKKDESEKELKQKAKKTSEKELKNGCKV
jgi:hypothetical protein